MAEGADKAEAKKDEPTSAEPNKPEAQKTVAHKAEENKTVAHKAVAQKSGAKKGNAKKAGSHKAVSKKSGPKKAAAKTTAKKVAAKANKKGGNMSGLDAAFLVLSQSKSKEGLTVKQLTEIIFQKKLWGSKGATPSATLAAAMIREIANKKSASRFRKVSPGKFMAK